MHLYGIHLSAYLLACAMNRLWKIFFMVVLQWDFGHLISKAVAVTETFGYIISYVHRFEWSILMHILVNLYLTLPNGFLQVETDGDETKVLLDSNFMRSTQVCMYQIQIVLNEWMSKYSCTQYLIKFKGFPLPLLEQSKNLLTRALQNDTSFLCRKTWNTGGRDIPLQPVMVCPIAQILICFVSALKYIASIFLQMST